MSDEILLAVGAGAFAMTLVGIVLTAVEFKQMEARKRRRGTPEN